MCGTKSSVLLQNFRAMFNPDRLQNDLDYGSIYVWQTALCMSIAPKNINPAAIFHSDADWRNLLKHAMLCTIFIAGASVVNRFPQKPRQKL